MKTTASATLLAILLLAAPSLALAQEAAPTSEPAPAAEATDAPWVEGDQRITRQLDALLTQVEGAGGVTHATSAGLITLRGEVPDAETKALVVALAGKLPDALGVQDKLTLPTPKDDTPPAPDVTSDEAVTARVTRVLGATSSVKGLAVEVNSGVVTLRGEVETTERGEGLAALAGKLEGVVHVINELTTPVEVSARISPAAKELRKLATDSIAFLPLLGVALVIFALTLSLARLIRRLEWPYRKLTDRPLMRELARQVAGTAVLLVGLLIVFEILDVTALVGALLGTAGLAGLAIGFAFQDIVENYLSSVMLSVQQPFNKGDGVTIGDHTGKVIRMTMRDTVLMTYDGNHVRIPNAQVFKATMTNFSRNPLRRFDFKVGVGTEENLVDVHRVALEVMGSIDGILDDPAPAFAIEELGDSSVLCGVYAWVDQRESSLRDVRSEALRRLKVRFEREEFEMPEPIYRVNLLNLEPHDRPAREPEPLEDSTLVSQTTEEAALDKQVAQDEGSEKDLL